MPRLPVEVQRGDGQLGLGIFKYSDERYDPEEWLFPGGGHVDGTVEGAMRAGLEAYPV